MPESDPEPQIRRQCVLANNRREAIGKILQTYPILESLYSVGPNNDGKAGWVNAIKDQREAAYRLLFYIDRLPLGVGCQDRETYEVLYGEFNDDDEPNYPRALFTTTGGINLAPDGLPDKEFTAALITDSLEIVPLSFERDMRTDAMLKHGYGYVGVYDREVDALRILDLRGFLEIYVLPEKQEVQVRNEETIIIGDATFVKPFFLKHRVKRAGLASLNPSDAAGRTLGEKGG